MLLDLYAEPFAHGGKIAYLETLRMKKFLDFSSNVNPYALPFIKEFFLKNSEALSEITFKYPDPETKELREKLAEEFNISPKNILCGNGATEIIYLIPKVLKIKHALILVPTFSEYERALKLNNSKVSFYLLEEKKGFYPELKTLVSLLKNQKSVDAVFMCNPNNPTGNLLFDRISFEELLSLGIPVILDESFMDFLEEEEKYTCLEYCKFYTNLFVIRGFTKFFGIPGLRLGFIIAHEKTIKWLEEFKMPWSVNNIVQHLAVYLINSKKLLNHSKKILSQEKTRFSSYFINSNVFKVFPSVTNFLLVKIQNRIFNSTWLTQELIKHGILIRDCKNFRGLNDKYFRIAIKTPEENASLLNALKTVVEGFKDG